MTLREPFHIHKGVFAPLLIDNIDTDQIIPSREMKTISRKGLGEGLFAGWRYVSALSREPKSDFILNKAGFENASILLAGANFGCGSSREHAVWALVEFGVRCIIAESFGEIFYGNCARNGLLAIALPVDQIKTLATRCDEARSDHILGVDLEKQIVFVPDVADSEIPFEIDAYQKRLLAGGLDPIALTLERQDEINSFMKVDVAKRPWIYA